MKIYSFNQILWLITLVLISTSSFAQNRGRMSTNGFEFVPDRRNDRPNQPIENSTCPVSEFRSFDGTCNNVSRQNRSDWGASDIELMRTMLPVYGSEDHLNAMSGSDRPSPRAISNVICSQNGDTPSQAGLSSFVFTWGQFLDHDISLTPEDHIEYEPIALPDDEPLFSSEIPFFRSAIDGESGDGTYRQQTNLITSYIDGSNVYGSSEDRANWLRTFNDGNLKMSSGNLLPYNTTSGELDGILDTTAPSMAGDNGGTTITFVAGDVRAAEQPGLTSLHTLFVRYHNLICDQLISDGVNGDEELYQRARRRVGAVIQSITYNEFLPALGVRLSRSRGYNANIRADISNIFATAAYRLGHTMVTDELLLQDDECHDINGGTISLLEGFFNPSVVAENGIDPILNGLARQVQNEVDPHIIDNLRNFLFGNPSAGPVFGLDLASLNIQRGRDHGLPDYNSVRRHYTGRGIRSFEDITDNQEYVAAIKSLYGDINNIDLWVGLLSEDLERGASLGRTLLAILESQFEKLRDGDRYFYTHDREIDRREEQMISSTKLSDVILLNTSISNIQENVFVSSGCFSDRATNRNSILHNANEEFELFPNPAADLLTLNFSQAPTGDVFIIDAVGRNVITLSNIERNEIIDVSDLVDGVYRIVYLTNGLPQTQSFVKAGF